MSTKYDVCQDLHGLRRQLILTQIAYAGQVFFNCLWHQ